MNLYQLSTNQRIFNEGLIVFPQNSDSEAFLVATRCRKCQKVFFPKRPFCTECLSEEMEEIALSSEATLYTYTVVHIGVRGFKTPYILGWIQFPEGTRIVSQIDYDPEKTFNLYPGQKLKLVIGILRTLDDNTEIVGYKFKPVF